MAPQKAQFTIEDAPASTPQQGGFTVEDAPAAPDDRPFWQRWKDNFNANTSGPKPGDTGIPYFLNSVGEGGGQAVHALAHPINTLTAFGHTLAHPIDSAHQEVDQLRSDPSRFIGNQIGNAAVMGAAGEGVAKGVGSVASKGADIVSGGTKAASDLSDVTVKGNTDATQANTDAAAAHNVQAQDAASETRGRELDYKNSISTKADDIAAKDASGQAAASQNYQDQLAKSRTHNQQVLDRHDAVKTRLGEQNDATDQTLAMRQKQQADLDDMTQKYYAQEDAAKAKAKGEENAAWQPWREKMDGVTIDGSEIAEPLQKIATSSPEVARVLRQLQPPAAEAAPDSSYAMDRAAIMKSQGYKGSYFDQPEGTRTIIDKIAASSGFEPDPIDFDPQPGKPIPVDQVHRANSILQSAIRNGRYEGPILGELKQVGKVLRAAVSRASGEQGALADLTSAREATMKYQDAFGRERYQPTTQDEIREKQANPEAFKERDDEDRLSKASQFDPDLVDSFRGVKAARENLKKLPTEDTLRKSLKQIPQPPSVGDIRPGYSLLPDPDVPQMQQPVGSPLERAQQQVPQPQRLLPPNRPIDTPTKTIGPEDIQNANRSAIAERAQAARGKTFSRIASGLAAYDVIRSAIEGNWQHAGVDIAARGGLAAAQYGFSKLLENPKVVDYLSKPTASQMAAIDPSVARGLQPLIDAAKSKGIKISPAITAAISAHGGKTLWYDQPR